jgi:hypothetical protein
LEAEKAAGQNWVRMQQNIAASAMENEQIDRTIKLLWTDAKPEATGVMLTNSRFDK